MPGSLPRRPRRKLLACALALAAVTPASACGAVDPVTDPVPGKQVKIAIVGDSVVEGYTTRNLVDGLVPRLTDELVARGFAPGGLGLIPAMPFRWSLSDPTAPEFPIKPGGWRVLGLAGPLYDGPSGYSAVATSPTATATTAVTGPLVTLLYVTNTTSTPFVVTGGGRIWNLNAQAPGPRHATSTELTLAQGTKEITVYGPQKGMLTFTGVVDSRPPAPGQVQVEVNNVAHAGQQPADTLKPRIFKAFTDQHYDVTVFLWSYVSEVILTNGVYRGDYSKRYERGMLPRALLARQDGGRCLILDKGPLEVAESTTRRFTAINERVAKEAGCAYSDALGDLWKHPESAYEQGFTQADNLHPTPRGYELMAKTLAPLVTRLIDKAAAADPVDGRPSRRRG